MNGSKLLNDGNVNFWRVRVNPVNPDGTLGDRVFDSNVSQPQDLQRRLSLDKTEFQVPEGFITEPGRYRVSIMLEGWSPFDRSRTLVDFGTDTGAIITIITNILLDED